MITRELIETKGKSVDEYLESISEKHKSRWEKKLERVDFTDQQIEFLEREDFLPIKIIAISEDWCPDCQNAIPVMMKMAEASSYLDLVIFSRDENQEDLGEYLTNGGFRIPFIMFANEQYQEIARWVERSTISYKLLYEAKLETIEEDGDDYGEKMREKFSEHSDFRYEENIREIFDLLEKAVYMRNASAKLDELKSKLTQIPQ